LGASMNTGVLALWHQDLIDSRYLQARVLETDFSILAVHHIFVSMFHVITFSLCQMCRRAVSAFLVSQFLPFLLFRFQSPGLCDVEFSWSSQFRTFPLFRLQLPGAGPVCT
jgi:hypothetical protein